MLCLISYFDEAQYTKGENCCARASRCSNQSSMRTVTSPSNARPGFASFFVWFPKHLSTFCTRIWFVVDTAIEQLFAFIALAAS
jgi:hypothetical protein